MKNNIYVVNQPVHNILSLVVVGDTFPLPQEEHEAIEELRKTTDIIFIFPNQFFKNQAQIDKDAFTNLYLACGYIETEDKFLGRAIFKTLLYDTEIFKTHLGFIFANLRDLHTTKEINEKLVLSVSGLINKPVCKVRRLKASELCEIYTKPEETVIDKVLGRKVAVNKYTTHTIDSEVIYATKPTILKLLDFTKEDGAWDYIEHFTRDDFRFLLASLFKKLKIDVLGVNLSEVKK